MADLPSHHMIYGTLTDYVSGETVVDTDDERYRQKLARFLVEHKGYEKADIEARLSIETLFAKQFVVSTVDLVVTVSKKRMMVIRYGPGSLVTRERPALAAARVLDPHYQIPLAVVTNGEDAEVLETFSGKVIGEGLAAIPDKNKIMNMLETLPFNPPPAGVNKEKELRILNAFDVEVCCSGGPCAIPGAREG